MAGVQVCFKSRKQSLFNEGVYDPSGIRRILTAMMSGGRFRA